METSNSDWMSKLNKIKTARREYAKVENIMSAWERKTASENINAEAKAFYPHIYQGVKRRLDDAKSNYKSAAAKRAEAIAKEINSWDSAKLNTEIQAFQTRVNMELSNQGGGVFSGFNPIAKRIGALYREAQASGDRYKMRAAAEVLQAVNTDRLPRDQRVDVQLVGREAIDQLESLRNTDEIKAAIDQENAAIKQLQDEQAFTREAGAVLRDDQELFGRAVGGFAKLASTVKFEQEGREVRIKILDLDDPELTGIIAPDEPDTIGGNIND